VTSVTALEPSGNLYGSEYCLLDIIEGTRSTFDWEVILPEGGGFDALLDAKGIPEKRLLIRNSHTVPLWKKIPGYLRVRRHLARVHPSVVYVNQAGMLRAATRMTQGIATEMVCQIQTLEDAKLIAELGAEHTRVRTFICNSHYIASHAGIAPEKLTVLYQPMMPANRPPVRDPIAPGPPWRVGILGRISETKGHYLLIDAAKILASRRSDIRFVVIGTGLNEEHTQRFEAAVRDAGLSSAFELRGYRSAAHEELSSLHLALIPSVAEPYGRVLLDAAATRVPAIVSDGGGLGELSEHFNIGRRFRSLDSTSLADSIEAALADYAGERARFSGASERMLERLDPDKYIEAVSAVIMNAAQGRSTAMEWLGENR
jgi:glycosyltransferase involved in cell wall biosynthesis